MANKKFSDFDLKTNSSDVAFVVGFNGSDNVRIAPSNLVVGGTPGGSNTQIQFNNGGAFGAGSFLTTNKSNNLEVVYELGLKGDGGSNQGLLKLYCEAGTAHHVGIKGPAHSGGSSYTLQLPNTLPNVANQVLESNAAGALSWIATPSGGGGGVTSIVAGSGISVNQATGAVTVSASGGGGGASSLNGLSDVSVDLTNDNAFFINIPSGISGATGCLFIGEGAGNSVVGSPKNIAIGFDAFKTASDNSRDNNVVIGYKACELSTNQVQYNVFIGNEAGKNLSNTYSNVAIGYQAMSTGAGFDSVAVGYRAAATATGTAMTAVGWQAGDGATGGNLTALGGSFYVGGAGSDVSAISCTAIGGGALQNASSEGCTAVGYSAGRAHTSGVGSTYMGFESGLTNTTSGYRTMVGFRSGKAHTGMFATGLGYNAMSAGTGILNVAVGSNSMMSNGGSRSTAIGHQAMVNCTGADDCVAIGQSALSNANAGDFNVAVGVDSLQSCQSSNNVAIGYFAGTAITTSPDNTFIGYQSGLNFNNTSGDGSNVAVGSTSAGALTTGIYNTFLGYGAGNGGGGTSGKVTTGNFNTMVGYQAKGSATAASNQNSFGYSAACSGNNQVTLGNSSIGTLRCAVTSITSLSDERDKSEIKDLEYGLAFIDALQPREFIWDNRPEIKLELNEDGNEIEEEFYSANKGKKDFGFIAQEVQELDNDTLRLVYSENEEKLELSYGKLVPILVKAIQELKEEVELLKAK